jgi:hypothetical protein
MTPFKEGYLAVSLEWQPNLLIEGPLPLHPQAGVRKF